jgi:hypothetical protein
MRYKTESTTRFSPALIIPTMFSLCSYGKHARLGGTPLAGGGHKDTIEKRAIDHGN